MQRYTIPKLLGLVLLMQVVLVAISFLEVFIYSIAVEPGHEESFYEAHAQVSAPWISGIFGFILCFLLTRFWTRKNLPNAFKLAWMFPLVYFIWDFIVVALIGVPDWVTFAPIFLLSMAAKVLGCFGGYYLNRS